MTWLVIGLLSVICLLLVIGTTRQGKISDLETEISLLTEENESLKLKITVLQNNMTKIVDVKKEIDEIEDTKKERPEKTTAPDSVDSRLARLNKLQDNET